MLSYKYGHFTDTVHDTKSFLYIERNDQLKPLLNGHEKMCALTSVGLWSHVFSY